MIVCLLAASAAATPAHPVRLLSGPVFRDDATTGITIETGLEAYGEGDVHLDVGIAVTTPHIFTYVGPRRSYASIDALADLGVDLGPFLTTGPTLGAAWRIFGQQGLTVAHSQTGLAGWMVTSTMLRTKLFGLTLTGRALVDTRGADLVLGNSQVVRMSRTELRFGRGVVFGKRRER